MKQYLLISLLLFAKLAFAHGGEDHSNDAAPLVVSSDGIVASTTGSVFEVVIKSPLLTPNETGTLNLLLSDFATNEPIKDAKIDIDLKGVDGFKSTIKATPTNTSGIYELSAAFPAEGKYSFSLTIQAAGRADLLLVDDFTLRPPTSVAAKNNLALWLGAAAIAVVSLLLGFGLGRIGRKKEITQ